MGLTLKNVDAYWSSEDMQIGEQIPAGYVSRLCQAAKPVLELVAVSVLVTVMVG